MKKIIKIILIMLSLILAGCLNVNDVNVDKNTQNSSNNLSEIEFDYNKVNNYSLTELFWYDENNLMLVFKIPSESEMKLFNYDINTHKTTLLYDGVCYFDSYGNILKNNEQVGYQNSGRALIFNRKTLQIVKDDRTDNLKDDVFRYYSPDMSVFADVKEDGIFVVDTKSTSKTKIADKPSSVISFNWSNDNKKIIYLTNNNSAVSIIDIASKDKITLTGGKDFENPEVLVDFILTSFLNNSSKIFISALCEDHEAFCIIDQTSNNKTNIIKQFGSTTAMAKSNNSFIYAVDEKDTDIYRLLAYDYINNKEYEIIKSNYPITSISFSPDGNSIIYSTYSDGKQKINVLNDFKDK